MYTMKCPTCGGEVFARIVTAQKAEIIVNLDHYYKWVAKLDGKGKPDQYLKNPEREVFPTVLPLHDGFYEEYEIYCLDCGNEIDTEELVIGVTPPLDAIVQDENKYNCDKECPHLIPFTDSEGNQQHICSVFNDWPGNIYGGTRSENCLRVFEEGK